MDRSSNDVALVSSEDETETEIPFVALDNVTGAIGAVGPCEFYLLQSTEGMSFEGAGSLMASLGCTYAAPAFIGSARIGNEPVSIGEAPDIVVE